MKNDFLAFLKYIEENGCKYEIKNHQISVLLFGQPALDLSCFGQMNSLPNFSIDGDVIINANSSLTRLSCSIRAVGSIVIENCLYLEEISSDISCADLFIRNNIRLEHLTFNLDSKGCELENLKEVRLILGRLYIRDFLRIKYLNRLHKISDNIDVYRLFVASCDELISISQKKVKELSVCQNINLRRISICKEAKFITSNCSLLTQKLSK